MVAEREESSIPLAILPLSILEGITLMRAKAKESTTASKLTRATLTGSANPNLAMIPCFPETVFKSIW